MFGVEPICRVLSEHGIKIAPSTYYAARSRSASARTVRDAWLRAEITRIFTDNYQVYGARKIWRQLQREGHQVARCTVERLMRELGLAGVRRGRKIRTTMRVEAHERAGDLLQRDFTAAAPNRRWVADFTHVATWAGVVYVEVFEGSPRRTHACFAGASSSRGRRWRGGRRSSSHQVRHGNAGIQQRAWQWAMDNRTPKGDLPPGRAIATPFQRSERWGRLVKQAGLSGRLDAIT